MMKYAKAHHLEIIGDPIEFCHIDRYETSNIEEYLIELQLPVA
jgi:effector-binding domain-containing protein